MFDLEGRGVPAVRPLPHTPGADLGAKTNYLIWKVAGDQTGPRLQDQLQGAEGALLAPGRKQLALWLPSLLFLECRSASVSFSDALPEEFVPPGLVT